MIDLETLKALDSAASPRGWQPVLLNDLSDVTYIEGTPLGHPAGKQAASFPDGKGGWTEGFADPDLQEQIHADARLICAARDALPALVEVAEAAQAFKKLIDTYAVPTLDNLAVNRNYYAEDIIASVLGDIEAASARLEEALQPFVQVESGGH